MGEYQSFVFDGDCVVYEPLKANCLIHFRPKDDWDGTQYGFDWMRTGDTMRWGDCISYKDIVCKQYKKDNETVLERHPNAYQGKFKTSPFLYSELEADYHPLTDLCEKNDSKYYCSWLSLFPETKDTLKKLNGCTRSYKPCEPTPVLTNYKNTSATLQLLADIETAPEYLEFGEHEAFKISPMRIDSIKGQIKGIHKLKEKVTIKCIKSFYEDQSIDIFAVQKNPYTGKIDDRKLVGRLYVWRNSSIKRPKVLFVEVKTPALPTQRVGESNENAKKRQAEGKAPEIGGEAFMKIQNYLRQALIVLDNVRICPLDITSDYNFREFFCSCPGNEPLINHRKTPGKSMAEHLLSKLKSQYGKEVNNYN